MFMMNTERRRQFRVESAVIIAAQSAARLRRYPGMVTTFITCNDSNPYKVLIAIASIPVSKRTVKACGGVPTPIEPQGLKVANLLKRNYM